MSDVLHLLKNAARSIGGGSYLVSPETMQEAIAEISALRAAAVGADVGAGWVLVPREPTEEMEAAYERAYSQKAHDIYSPTPTEHYEDGGGAFGYGYRAMLKAAPAVGARDGAEVKLGFASFHDGSFELIVQNKTGQEETLHGQLRPGQLQRVDRILPTCVMVSGEATRIVGAHVGAGEDPTKAIA